MTRERPRWRAGRFRGTRPVRRARLSPVAVQVHGRAQRVWDQVNRCWNAPKRELISGAKVLLQTDRLRIARTLADRETLIKELLDYRVTIGANGHDTYAADWREGAHDDLVFATALAAWYAERFGRPPERPRPILWGAGDWV